MKKHLILILLVTLELNDLLLVRWIHRTMKSNY
jgi:hypothetical protein